MKLQDHFTIAVLLNVVLVLACLLSACADEPEKNTEPVCDEWLDAGFAAELQSRGYISNLLVELN